MIRYFALLVLLMIGSSDVLANRCATGGQNNSSGEGFAGVPDLCAQGFCAANNAAVCDAVGGVYTSVGGAKCTPDGLGSNLLSFANCTTSCPSGQIRVDGWCQDPDFVCPTGTKKEFGKCVLTESGPGACADGYKKFTVGNQTSCIEQLPSQCGNGGKVWINGVDACQDEKDACNNAGGTFGIVNTSPVCIPSDYANQMPTCASGSAEYFDNGNGTSAFACATVTTPASERAPVNVTAEDPTGLGGKFDEVIQALERGTAVLRSGMGGAVPPVAGGTGPGQGPGEGEGEGEGEESGECDPTATDYASCIGNTNLVGDNDASDLIGDSETAGTSALNDMETEWIDSLGESLPIDEPTGIKGIIQAILPAPTECQEIGYDWQGGRITLDCGKLNDLKAWLGFMLYFFTAFTIYQIVMAPAASKV